MDTRGDRTRLLARTTARLVLLALAAAGCSAADAGVRPAAQDEASVDADPFLWLEEVEGERALAWVAARNSESRQALTQGADFAALQARLRSILDSDARIPYVEEIGGRYYNFWKDAQHERGIWRRTTPAEYLKPAPAWETVLDLDALSREEGTAWVWHGADCLRPEERRCLVALSPGGKDADVTREFDLEERRFVEGGFVRPEAKGGLAWIDHERVYAFSDFGPGSLTASGYPRVVKEWRRGTPLAEARILFEAEPTDMSVAASHDPTPGFERDVLHRTITFYTNEIFLRAGAEWVKVDKPLDANCSFHRDLLLLELRSDWSVAGQTFPAGSLLSAPVEGYLKGERRLEALFTPTERSSLGGLVATRSALVLTVLDNVRTRLEVLRRGAQGAWTREALAGLPEFASLGAWAIDPIDSDEVFISSTDFLTPSRLLRGSLARGADAPLVLKELPAFFDAKGLTISQLEATSRDGTRVPYFLVRRAELPPGGANPTLLYGYGGFEVPMLPGYSALQGAAWLERGGVYALANIRGGGEFGPRWHQAALRENRQRAYDDFIAVAEDLIARGLTSPKRLGILGGSNGGLLVGNMLVQRPDLFGAVVCAVPLLDMRRYHKLLAGASWVGEYGDPDKPEDWAFLKSYSPYQLVRAGTEYPPIFFFTSTRDDRVHPGHARKMVAKMLAQGHPRVLYFENTEGGHAGAATHKQSALMWAQAYTFLWQMLSGPGSTSGSAGSP